MLNVLLAILSLLFSFSAFAQSGYNPGAQAIRYLAGQAADKAEAVRASDEFSSAKIDDYQFYHSFVSYGGASHLSDEILGSWEFADRIENLRPYWSPVDTFQIERVKEMAREARKRTGVKYNADEANVNAVTWWNQNVVAIVEKLEAGGKVEIKEGMHTEGLEYVIEAAATVSMSVELGYSVGQFVYDDDIDGRVWETTKYEARGSINKNAKLNAFLLNGPEVRKKKGNSKFKSLGTNWTEIRGIHTISKMTGNFKELKRALGFGYMEKLLAGKQIPIGASHADFTAFRDIIESMGMWCNFEPNRTRLQPIHLLEFRQSLPRVKGVYPKELCEQRSVE